MSDLDNARKTVTMWVNERRNTLSQTYFTFAGYQWDCDQVSRSNINGLLTIGLLNGGHLPPMTWRTYDNNNIPITMQFMAGMAVSLGTFVTMTYSASWIHKANIAQITTSADDVYAYDFTNSLWPDPNTQY